jgi:bifunctional UDP-N-acetylglucosamine pyrophosphorylase/glucosamine-1-phosphate N-acetyltransferase
MKAVILDAESPETCHPLTATRPLAACRVGNRLLTDIQQEILKDAGFGPSGKSDDRTLFLRGDAWLSRNTLAALLQTDDIVAVRNSRGAILAWTGESANAVLKAPSIPMDADTFLIVYPWDILRINEIILTNLSDYRIDGESIPMGPITTPISLNNGAKIYPGAHIDGTVLIGSESRILPGVYIEGTVVIGKNCKIGPNCYIRGNTSIGDGCHIGQAVEIKNSIIMNRTCMGHLSYCGDSIIGESVNFGAGTITSNYRHDGLPHKSMINGRLVDTGRRKFGTVMGDRVHTGIHTSIYPGRKLWPGICTLPGAIVSKDVVGEQPGLQNPLPESSIIITR